MIISSPLIIFKFEKSNDFEETKVDIQMALLSLQHRGMVTSLAHLGKAGWPKCYRFWVQATNSRKYESSGLIVERRIQGLPKTLERWLAPEHKQIQESSFFRHEYVQAQGQHELPEFRGLGDHEFQLSR